MTEPFHLARIPLHLDALHRLAADRGWSSSRESDTGRALHHALGECFGPRACHPFRLMTIQGQRHGFVYGYCHASADGLREAAAPCGPEYEALFALQAIQTKQMPVAFPAGRRLGFDLRAWPVRRTRKPNGDRETSREIDAFLHEALSTHAADEPRLTMGAPSGGGMAATNRTREAVYTDWLSERLTPGATLDAPEAVRLAQFRRVRRHLRQGRTEGPDATLQGTLTVTDPDEFMKLVRDGVGRHKAYGFGMLLLRPA